MSQRRAFIFAFALSIAAAGAASAQVTIQHGNSLSELINNLYGGNGIQLKETGHQAHFGQTDDFQKFSQTLQAVLQSRPVFPIPSAVGLVSYRFDEATGTYERVEGSLGPVLAERGSTTGKGHLNLSMTYTFSDFDQINGEDSIPLVLRHCLAPECTGGRLDLPFLKDTINVDVRFRLKTQALALSAVYGATNNLDLALVIPYLRNDLSVFTHGTIVVSPGSSPLNHSFDPSVETPDQMVTGTAIGIGDIVARAKLKVLPRSPFDAALMTDITFPTGDKENFLGTGRTKVKETFILSKTIKRFVPHLNAGYEFVLGETKLNSFDYRLGSEIAVTPKLTASVELLGAVRPRAASLFESAALNGQSLVGRSEIDGVLGAKWRLSENRALIGNLIVPMNDASIRSSTTVTAGLQLGL